MYVYIYTHIYIKEERRARRGRAKNRGGNGEQGKDRGAVGGAGRRKIPGTDRSPKIDSERASERARVCVRACVRVCEREKKRAREGERERERENRQALPASAGAGGGGGRRRISGTDGRRNASHACVTLPCVNGSNVRLRSSPSGLLEGRLHFQGRCPG